MTPVEDKRDLLKTPLHGIYIPSLLILGGSLFLSPQLLFPVCVACLVGVYSYHYFRIKLQNPTLSSKKFQSYELIDKTIISKNSAIYRFKLENDASLNIPVGHHLACQVKIEGVEHVRYYTPINNKFDSGFFDIIVKSYKDGTVSKYFASLNPGQFVDFKGPVGRMSYKKNMAKEIYMIAGGSGITPMLSVLGDIITTPEDTTLVKLIFANETENDILLKEELEDYAEKYPNLQVVQVLNKPSNNWTGYTGYVTEELLNKEIPAPSAGRKVFICGPMEMKKSLLDILFKMGWDKGVLQSKQNDQVFCF